MARVTVEDCVLKVPNRFDLVMLAAQRARDISAGAPLTLERDYDKNPVVALREIADENVSIDTLGEALISGMQKHVEIDEPEEEPQDFEMAIVAMSAQDANQAMGVEDDEEAMVTVDALVVDDDNDEAEEMTDDAAEEVEDEEPEGT